ncbi:protein max-like isoform X2 [Paramacrobiotus metropolitanus]|uniref:protein max-like isoform X2 n=1 Tax=Paramacrobiotus metropolitanus TaxID=2943436 RepID=UPI00244604FE|nr:protein max-like isoform X2 [Paramacrobiotus metropolitanus]
MAAVNGTSSPVKSTSAEKRAVHNALERKRRDHIKDMFSQLKDSVPNLSGEKASRAQILKKACDYIQLMRRKNTSATKDLDMLTQQITRTKKQIAKLESVRNTTRYVSGLSPPESHVLPAPSPSEPPQHFNLAPAHSLSTIPTLTLPPQGYGTAPLLDSYRMINTRLPSLFVADRGLHGSPLMAARGGMMETAGEGIPVTANMERI